MRRWLWPGAHELQAPLPRAPPPPVPQETASGTTQAPRRSHPARPPPVTATSWTTPSSTASSESTGSASLRRSVKVQVPQPSVREICSGRRWSAAAAKIRGGEWRNLSADSSIAGAGKAESRAREFLGQAACRELNRRAGVPVVCKSTTAEGGSLRVTCIDTVVAGVQMPRHNREGASGRGGDEGEGSRQCWKLCGNTAGTVWP